MISGNHLHLHSRVHQALHRNGRVVAWWVDHGQQAQEMHALALDPRSYSLGPNMLTCGCYGFGLPPSRNGLVALG